MEKEPSPCAFMFSGPISKYLNPILALASREQAPNLPRRTAKTQSLKAFGRIEHRKSSSSGSPERQKSPPRPISPPNLQDRPKPPSFSPGKIINRKQFQENSSDLIRKVAIFALLKQENAGLLHMISQENKSPEVAAAEECVQHWAPLPKRSAFEYGTGEIPRREDLYRILKDARGESRIKVYQALGFLSKIKAGRLFSSLKTECGKLEKARNLYFSQLKAFIVTQSKAKRDVAKSLNQEPPFLAPGASVGESKHFSCLQKGKNTKGALLQPEFKQVKETENKEFKLQMLKNIYEKQLMKTHFEALLVNRMVGMETKRMISSVARKANLQVTHLILAAWIHIMLQKSERKKMMEVGKDAIVALRKKNVFQAFLHFSHRKEKRDFLLSQASKHYDLTLCTRLIYYWKLALGRIARALICKQIAYQHYHMTLLAHTFTEFRDYISSQLAIKDKITNQTRAPSMRTRETDYRELVKSRIGTLQDQLRSLSPALPQRTCSAEVPSRAKSRKSLSQVINETLHTPRLEPISALGIDPVLAKYLSATTISVELSPGAKQLEAHRKYAQQRAKFNPAELDPPDETRVPDYFPMDVGLFSTPISSPYRQSTAGVEVTTQTIDKSMEIPPSIEFLLNSKPSLRKDGLTTQIRSLWLYRNTLKRFNPAFHTLRARKIVSSNKTDTLIKDFLRVRSTSKLFTEWKKAYVSKHLDRHLSIYSQLSAAKGCFVSLRRLTLHRNNSDSRAEFVYHQNLMHKTLFHWTNSSFSSEDVVRSFRLKSFFSAWKQYQSSVAQRLVLRINARKTYLRTLVQKGFAGWRKFIETIEKQRRFSEGRIKTQAWRFWVLRMQHRTLLRRVITTGLENYRDDTVSKLRSDANLLSQVIAGWKRTSLKKRKTRDQQLKRLTADNWKTQKAKVRVFFQWKERTRLTKGSAILMRYWKGPCSKSILLWKSATLTAKQEKRQMCDRYKETTQKRVLAAWSEWSLQEKIIRAVRRRKALTAWKVGIYQVTNFPRSFRTRKTKKRTFGIWKKEHELIVNEHAKERKLTLFAQKTAMELKKMTIGRFILNVLNRRKAEELKFLQKHANSLIKFHHILRKMKKFQKRHKEENLRTAKMRSFRAKLMGKMSAELRLSYMQKCFSAILQYESTRKRGLILIKETLNRHLNRYFRAISTFASMKSSKYEETLRFSSHHSDLDAMFRNLEDTFVSSQDSLYKSTRPRKVRFAGEIDTSSVNAGVKRISEDVGRSWLDEYQRREQEKRAEIHKELDSLQASLLSSLKSKTSKGESRGGVRP